MQLAGYVEERVSAPSAETPSLYEAGIKKHPPRKSDAPVAAEPDEESEPSPQREPHVWTDEERRQQSGPGRLAPSQKYKHGASRNLDATPFYFQGVAAAKVSS